MTRLLTTVLGAFSLVAVFTFHRASTDIPKYLSPQGCRMSWMSPSYVLQPEFNRSWTPLGDRYSLWLYREVGWHDTHVTGVPVLFIPGNAGSSHQVRSIASSATRQFYSSPYVVADEFGSRGVKPLDFFAVEFNEDFSALHGPTLESQIAYTSRAISYILTLYAPNTSIIIMGHSMGGIVATSLLPSAEISAIITMSTPHTLPPARFDSRIDTIYEANDKTLFSDPTPILSLCGGATDTMVPSESCVLPEVDLDVNVYRRTVFTSALEGAWTGVGHREMVWCHQVRWRVARAALELGLASSVQSRELVLDRWLRDGHKPPPAIESHLSEFPLSSPDAYEVLPEGLRLGLKKPHGGRTYLLPVPSPQSKFVLFVSQGSIPPVSPQNPLPLQADVFFCQRHELSSVPRCRSLIPTTLKLIPNPVPGTTFPVPSEGSDESEGVVLYEADIPLVVNNAVEGSWVGVRIANADGSGWVVGGFAKNDVVKSHVSIWSPFLSTTSISLSTLDNANSLRTQIYIPNLLSNALVVYSLIAKPVSPAIPPTCSELLVPPLLVHTSQASETHYFPVSFAPLHPISLHTHSSAPFIPDFRPLSHRGLNITIYSSGSSGCNFDVAELNISIDWWGTLGRLAVRYPTTLISWTVGVTALVVNEAWRIGDAGGPVPNVQQSLSLVVSETIPKLLLGSFLISFLPLPSRYYLGNGGEIMLAPIAPLLILISTGLVCVSWWVLSMLMWPIDKIGRILFGRRREPIDTPHGAFFSMCIIFLLIFLFVPWQVAFLGCWIIHLTTCATSFVPEPAFESTTPPTAIPLINRDSNDTYESKEIPQSSRADNFNFNAHLLVLMTWLLPLVGPVLAVWVRTLITAGFTTPFDGDHNFSNVAPFLVLVDFASWGTGSFVTLEGRSSVRWLFVVVAMIAFSVGSRAIYRVFDATNIAFAGIVLIRIGPRYLGRLSWPRFTAR